MWCYLDFEGVLEIRRNKEKVRHVYYESYKHGYVDGVEKADVVGVIVSFIPDFSLEEVFFAMAQIGFREGYKRTTREGSKL